MKDSAKAILGIGFYAAVAYCDMKLNTIKYSFGGPSIYREGYEINRNPNLLVKEFADILETLFRNLREKGFDPFLWEGYRNIERQKFLAERGTGGTRPPFYHNEGKAVDIVSEKDLWNNSEFFAALGNEALKLGLVWGGNFKSRKDYPHVEYHG